MVYNDSDNKQGILQECEFWVFGSKYGSITSNTTRLEEFTRLSNNAMDKVSVDILDSDTKWQWDDDNYTDFPIDTKDLVDGKQNYTLDSDHIKVLSVEVKDASGNYYPLKPIDRKDMQDRGISPTEFMETNGIPQYYDMLGSSILLYPKPDAGSVTVSEGLKLHYQRPGKYFVTTDTTATPGFPSPFHRMIALYASLDYARSNVMVEKVNILTEEVARETDKLKRLFQKRNKDSRPTITMKTNNPK
jgi:hypothetical protein